MDTVEKLGISGCNPWEEEARATAVQDGALPSLKEFSWVPWDLHTDSHPIDLITTIKILLSTPQSSSRTPIRVFVPFERIDVEKFFTSRAPDELVKHPRLELITGDGRDSASLPNQPAMAKALFDRHVVKARI